MSALTDEIRSKIAKASGLKGGFYERDVAKKICTFFGASSKDWTQYFNRTRRTTGGQPDGDLFPKNEMANIWFGSGMGPIETKYRKEWAFDQLFKNPEGCHLTKYWLKSNADTGSDSSIVVFSKAHVTDYILTVYNEVVTPPVILYRAAETTLIICTLTNFLQSIWPDPPTIR